MTAILRLTFTYACCGIEWTEVSIYWPPLSLACPECGISLNPVHVQDGDAAERSASEMVATESRARRRSKAA